MKQEPLGIYYLDYSDVLYPRSKRKMIIGYTRKDLLNSIKEAKISDTWFCWLQECRTPGYLVDGNVEFVSAWISKHIPDKFGDPLNNYPPKG